MEPQKPRSSKRSIFPTGSPPRFLDGVDARSGQSYDIDSVPRISNIRIDGKYPEHIGKRGSHIICEYFGHYESPTNTITRESVSARIDDSFMEWFLSEANPLVERACKLRFDNSDAVKTYSCPHKVKDKTIGGKCDLCELQRAVGEGFSLYASGMHPHMNGREKVYRWRCNKCKRDLFASKDQMRYLSGSSDYNIDDTNSKFITDCMYLHTWSVMNSEYVQQVVRRIFEVVTGYPCDDAVPSSAFTCYNNNVPFAVYMPDAFPYVVWNSVNNMQKLQKEAISICRTNAKHLMIVERYKFDEKLDQTGTKIILTGYMTPETFAVSLYNFLLVEGLLQAKFVPLSSDIAEEDRYVRFSNGSLYSRDKYFEALNNFVYMVMKLLEHQSKNDLMLYTSRENLTGSNEFIIYPSAFY